MLKRAFVIEIRRRPSHEAYLQGETIITCFVLEDRLTLGWGFTNVEGVNHVFRAEDGEGQ
jgi:hypothetical protein